MKLQWTYDGGADVHGAMDLTGEPLTPQIAGLYGKKPSKEASASEISATNVAKREYQKEYMEYWNGTVEETGTGRPVDAVIMPLAPFAAARPGTYTYYAYTSIINLLDYTSCAFPVTRVDKTLDAVDTDFKPMSDVDKETAAICEFQCSGRETKTHLQCRRCRYL